MNLKYLISTISLFVFLSCSSIPNNHFYLKDYYSVTNKLINNASITRDSVYIFDKFSSENIEKQKFFYLFYYMEREGESAQIYSTNFKEFLAKHNINYTDEVSYFKEQVSKPVRIDNKRINLKKFKVYPMTKRNIDKYMLKSEYSQYNQNFAINLFSYSDPVFTKDGKSAIVNHGRAHSNYFSIYKKINNEWIEIDKYDSRGITVNE